MIRRANLMRLWLALERASVPAEDRGWFYLDKQGLRQGPFPSHLMKRWMDEGHLPDNLLVSFARPQGGYSTLSSLFRPPHSGFENGGKDLEEALHDYHRWYHQTDKLDLASVEPANRNWFWGNASRTKEACLLYTSDAADEP